MTEFQRGPFEVDRMSDDGWGIIVGTYAYTTEQAWKLPSMLTECIEEAGRRNIEGAVTEVSAVDALTRTAFWGFPEHRRSQLAQEAVAALEKAGYKVTASEPDDTVLGTTCGECDGFTYTDDEGNCEDCGESKL